MSQSYASPTKTAKALGYKVSDGGICLGYATLGMQAIIIDELQKFVKRNELMSDKTYELGINGLAQALKSIEEKRVEIIESYKSSLLEKCEIYVDMTDSSEFYRFLEENKAHPLVIEFTRLRDLVDTQLSLEMRSLVDMHAYIQLMAFYAASNNFPELFEKNTAPIEQNVVLALPIGLPDSLLKVNTVEEKKEENASPYLKKIPLVKQVTTLVGLYNQEELTEFFKQLRLATDQCIPPVVFLLTSGKHAVSVAYDSRIPCWQFIDIKRMPLVQCSSDGEIAAAVLHSLSKNNVATFITEVYCHQKLANDVGMSLYQLTQTDEWAALHHIDGKENLSDSNGATLLFTATINGNIDLVTNILKNKTNTEQIFRGGISPFLMASSYGFTEIIKEFLKYKSTNINVMADSGATPLYKAAQNNHVEIVKLLIQDNEHKLNPFAASSDGATPFNIAAEKGNHAIIKLFIERYSIQNLKSSMCMQISELLEHADIFHRKDYVNHMLISKIGDQEHEIHNFSPLHAAIFFGHLDVVKTLIAAGFNIHEKTHGGITGLDFAIAMNHTAIIDELKNAMANQIFNKLNLHLESQEMVDLVIDAIAHADVSMIIMAETIFQNIKQLQFSEKYKIATAENKIVLMQACISSAKMSDHPLENKPMDSDSDSDAEIKQSHLKEKVKNYFVNKFTKKSSSDDAHHSALNPHHKKKKK